MNLKFFRGNFFLILAVFVAGFLRFLYLDRIPTAIGGDEMIYLLTGKAIWLTGTDLTGVWNPLTAFVFRYPPGETQAELLYFLNSPFVGLMNFSLLSARMANAILGTLTVIPLYFFTKNLINKKAAIVAAFIFAINPWAIYSARTAYEMTPAVFFYILSLSFIFSKKNIIILSVPTLILAFYSYIATKLIFFPLVAVAVFYGYYFYNNKQFKKQYLTVLLFSFALILFFAISLKVNSQGSRMGEILSPNSPQVAKQVNEIRQNSIQTPFANFLENKFAEFKTIAITKLLKVFSTEYLFVSGDDFFSIYRHGLFYFIDGLFLALGALFLFAKKRKVFIFLTAFSLLGAVPQFLYGSGINNFSPHIAMLIPFLIIFIAVGILETTQLFKKDRLILASIIIISVIYFVSTVNFYYIYFFQHSLKGYFDFPVRIVSRYSVFAGNKDKITIYSTRSGDIFKKYLFYTNNYNLDTVQPVKKAILNKKYTLNNVSFVSCDNALDFSKPRGIVIYDIECGTPVKEPKNARAISKLSDGGRVYRIYGDTVCTNERVKSYADKVSLADFDVENLSKKEFCETFITSLYLFWQQ